MGETEVIMKFPFFKVLAVSGAILLAWNCSNDTTDSEGYVPQEAYWALESAGETLQISPTDFAVRDAEGNIVGAYDVNTGSIIDFNGQAVISGLDLNTLKVVNPDGSVLEPTTPATPGDDQNVVIDPNQGTTTQPGDNTTTNPATTDPATNPATTPTDNQQANTPASSATTADTPKSSAAQAPKSSAADTPKSSSSEKKSDGGKIGNLTYTGSLEQDVANDGSIQKIVFSNVQSDPNGSRDWKLYFLDMKYDGNAKTLTITGTVRDQKDKTLSESFKIDGNDVTITLNIGSAAKGNTSNNNNQAKSSSSQQQAKSSSSQQQAKSSSSQQQNNNSNVQAEAIKEISGGHKGSGWATRYWDCCKPSCAWKENAGSAGPAKSCDAKGKNQSDGQSICSGGNTTTCTSQVPIIVNDNLAYAFAAVPASAGGQCGKCFALEFTGEGKYESVANHKALKGKTLIVMASNIGGDVNPRQFDVMIPGGGLGAFDNGCGQMGWGNQGEKYGGLLSNCENEVGYSGDLLKKRKECLTSKCNDVFKNDEEAKAGCLFLATWMEAAGNPNHNYKEVECPSALKAKW